ncbi:GNAT family N-acetyltransferase [Pseudonocardia spinosispora]|uniref:GNAT family N-acetyltransferase n=1 Tax=Pseudonocardia spinosispora TaxID=103441 RepID=UPI0003FD005A|nr:GNAT family N-acetyltransferase [Pseudonocardia spinosispora]
MALALVRAATPDDVDEIVRIQADTWRAAYAELVPEAALERLSGPAARAAWTAAVAAGDGHHVLVATEGEWIVGFCAVAPADEDEPELAAGLAQIVTLLVEPRWGRRGHGRRLLGAAFELLVADGAEGAIAWLPEQDVASRACYDRIGWDPDGMVRTLDAGDRELREIRLGGPLRVANRDPRSRSFTPDGFPDSP